MRILLLSIAFLFVMQGQAHAYVGPGLGTGALGVILGVIGSVFLALFAIIWYPIKRLLRRRKGGKPRESDS